MPIRSGAMQWPSGSKCGQRVAPQVSAAQVLGRAMAYMEVGEGDHLHGNPTSSGNAADIIVASPKAEAASP